jgi:nitric oxide reductase subunit B
MGFFMFVARYFLPHDNKIERAMKISFWSLNIGLMAMILLNLVPLGILQLNDSFQFGYWHARDPSFFENPTVRFWEWMRLPGDLLFIIGGILPVVYIAIRMFTQRNRGPLLPAGDPTQPLVKNK